MRIAIAQMNTVPADFGVTVERMVEFARQAKGQGAELVVFPYAALTGDEPVPGADAEGFLLDASSALSALAGELPCAAIVPVVVSLDQQPMPEAMLVQDGRITPLRLTNYIHGMFAAGDDDAREETGSIPIFELGGCKMAVSFGEEDLEELRQYEYDANVIIHINSFPFALNDTSSAMGSGLSNNRYLDDADQTSCWIVGVNGVGGYGDEAYVGSSFVLAPWGEIAAQAPSLEETLVVADVDPASEGPLPHPLEREVYDPGLMGWGALSLCVRDLVAKSDHTDVAVLLDGTLQSALVAALATDSVGPVRVHAVLAKPRDKGLLDATRATAKALRIADVREQDLPEGEDAATAAGLAQVRLDALAREHDAIALSNIDKTSLALDDLTHGVAVAAFAPLGDVYRTDVLWLARMRNTISPVIAPSLMVAYACPDLPGLADVGQTDEARLEFVDSVLESYVDWGRSVTEITAYVGRPDVALAIADRLRGRELGRALRMGSPAVLSRVPLTDAPSSLASPWRDRPRSQEELDEAERIEGMAEGEDARPSGDAAWADRSGADVAKGVAEFLRDYLGGAFGNPGSGDEGGDGLADSQGGWAGPFSQN